VNSLPETWHAKSPTARCKNAQIVKLARLTVRGELGDCAVGNNRVGMLVGEVTELTRRLGTGVFEF